MIKEILKSNKTFRTDFPIPTKNEVMECEKALGMTLDQDYKLFVELDGLNDLQFDHDILSPAEIIENKEFINHESYYPVASNGCGDLFCLSEKTSEVYFWSHEEKSFSVESSSFTEWLIKTRLKS